MKIPRSFKLKGKEWNVAYKWNLHLPGVGPCNGICDYDTRTIYLDRLATAEDKHITFLHEFIHATLYESHLQEDGGVDGFAEEVICASVANAFNELFEMRWRKRK